MNTSDILTHYAEHYSEHHNAVSPPIYQSSNFCFSNFQELREGLKDEFGTPFYTRGYNPTVATLRKKIAALEKAEDSLVFSSGSAAIAAAIFSCVKAGDHIVSVDTPYSWTKHLIQHVLTQYGVTYTMVDGTDVENFRTAIQDNTKLIYLESPNSLTFEMQDLEAVALIARTANIPTICDNSFATPLNQNPIALGIDIVVHSASKYINGHSDVVAGVLASSSERVKAIMAEEFMTFGGIIGPMEAWLILRGLRTLDLRVEKSTQSALEIIEMLEVHDKVSKVIHPFSSDNPQKELAEKQMKTCGGLITLELNTTDIQAIERFVDHLQYFLIACSWGGYESLQFPLAALTTSESYAGRHDLINKVRIYVGLEDVELLKQDLLNALEQV